MKTNTKKATKKVVEKALKAGSKAKEAVKDVAKGAVEAVCENYTASNGKKSNEKVSGTRKTSVKIPPIPESMCDCACKLVWVCDE